jgi:hypothetical protein
LLGLLSALITIKHDPAHPAKTARLSGPYYCNLFAAGCAGLLDVLGLLIALITIKHDPARPAHPAKTLTILAARTIATCSPLDALGCWMCWVC